MVRVRIAPSPTGIPHIGTTRTALFNFLFARHNKGKFLLRIEDTDRARFVPEAEKAIIEILEWLGITWDEKVERQSDRLSIYKEHAEILRKKGLVYDDSGAIRFNMPKVGQTEWKDAIGGKVIVFENKTQEDFVIIKSDGYPTYNFANVIDDHLMNITHVIRGEEFISSTPKHIQLYKAFDWNLPIFAHLPVILGPDKTKLSKRHGAKSALDYREEGYLKEALLNYMVLLGWNPGGDKEFLTIDEMIELFDLPGVNLASPIFDVKKLEWLNGEYIRKSQISRPAGGLKSQIMSQNPKLKDIDDSLLDKLIPLAQTRMKTLNDFYPLVKFIIEKPIVELDDKEKELAKKLLNEFQSIEKWDSEKILSAIKKVLESLSDRMPAVYKIITGSESGLPLPQTLEILGKDWTIKRLQGEVR